MLLTPTCVACGVAGHPVCRPCERRLERTGPAPPPLGLDGWWALLGYDEVARAVVLRAKNGQRRDLVPWLADRAARVPVPPGAVVTWAPTARARRHRRGYDQAELLARALARRWGRPCRPLLQRLPGPPQEGRRGSERRAHPGFATTAVVPRSVVVVDDVATTGATLAAAARALREAGAEEVRALVAARAPTPVARRG